MPTVAYAPVSWSSSARHPLSHPKRGWIRSSRYTASVVDRFGPEAEDLSARDPAYRELAAVYEHGEYGPTLVRRSDSARSIAATTRQAARSRPS